MPENSPWFQIYSFAPPNFPYCGIHKEGWVHDPIDTYSSIFYLIVSFILLYKAKSYPVVLKRIAYIPFFVALGSTLFHMSFTFVFLVADFLGIFFLNFYGVSLNLARLKKIELKNVLSLSLLSTFFWGVLMVLVYRFKVHTGILMIPVIVSLTLTEYLCWRKEKNIFYKNYIIAFILCLAGYVCMLLEGVPFRYGCSGAMLGKLQLHSLWHLLSSISMFYIFKFYSQKTICEQLQESSNG